MDWHRIFFSDHPYDFFIEILFRTPIMFLGVVLVLRLTGKRGVQQLSIFEMVMIITLGSATGDAMFYEDVGLFHALAVFVIVLILYRLIVIAIARSEKAEKLLEGEPLYLIKDGAIRINEIDGDNMGADEFFGELRGQHIEHLGQLRCVILEDTGTLSVFFYPEQEVRYGLPILPDEFKKKSAIIPQAGLYACARCGNTQNHSATDQAICTLCENNEWVLAINTPRIT